MAIGADTVGQVEEGEPIGPSAADEALASEGAMELPSAPPPPVAPAKRLPPLDSLLARMAPATRHAIDEHLRARFVRVRRLNPGDLR